MSLFNTRNPSRPRRSAVGKGQEPTPHGLLKVALRKEAGLQATSTIPSNVHAMVLFPVSNAGDYVQINGSPRRAPLIENGTRMAFDLTAPGRCVAKDR